MSQYRITHGLEIWFAEEKTSFGWETLYGTYADTEEQAAELLEAYKRAFRPDHVKLIREIESENRLAVVTPQEVKFLFDSLPPAVADVRRVVWNHAQREDYRKLMGGE